MPEYDLYTQLPTTVLHADWSTNPGKRWVAKATLEDGQYRAHEPELVGEVSTMIDRLRRPGRSGPELVGLDLPLGIPVAYAKNARIEDFPSWLRKSGAREWAGLYAVAESPEQVGLGRPFYPKSPFPKGSKSQRHLVEGLDLPSKEALLRECDRLTGASPLFWCVGPKAVGKAAISGWRDLLIPALRSPELGTLVWPFAGELPELLEPGRTVLAETYPAELSKHLGVEAKPKTSREARRDQAGKLLGWADGAAVDLTPGMRAAIKDGFGPSAAGEDPFDATVGLFGMLNVVLGYRAAGAPTGETVRKLEGWMLGLAEPASANEQETRIFAGDPPFPGHPEYAGLADLYDIEYDHDYDLPLWLTLAEREPGPVVEWGAGTGRIALPLSRAGHDVTAVELSEPMANRGREKGVARWITGDMRHADPGREFGLAVCAFNSFLCLTSPDAALAFLANASAHLRPGGLLGIEVSAFRPEELAAPPGGPALQHDLTRELPDGGSLERFSVSSYDAADQLLSMRLFYELYDRAGVMHERRSGALEIRPTTRDELTLMLQLAGFTVEAICGGFNGEPFTADSDHLIVLARPGDAPREA